MQTKPRFKPNYPHLHEKVLPADAIETLSFSLPTTGYVRLPVVVGVCGIARSTIWKWCADGRFPKPRKLSAHVSAWPVAEVRAWIADPEAWRLKRDSGIAGA
jgi:predicted DNA-binding transcriptional regulator AlpA